MRSLIFVVILSNLVFSQDTTLIEYIRKLNLGLYIKAKPSFEFIKTKFYPLDKVRYYDEFGSKRISEVDSEIKFSGFVFYDFEVGISYDKILTAGIKFATTSFLSPVKLKGYYRERSGLNIHAVDRNYDRSSLFVHIKPTRYTAFYARYESESVRINASKGFEGSVSLTGNYKILGNKVVGLELSIGVSNFNLAFKLEGSARGRFDFYLWALDTIRVVNDIITRMPEVFEGNGNIKYWAVESELSRRLKNFDVGLLLRYNYMEGKSYFRDMVWMLGISVLFKIL